ncbi:DNA polymerase delta, subunit 4-domain-containing protein, partial [Halteromyces radiatus]|uniref:DNA polymerase delta, subunit 4-domain-containing protein n=1 Tax=Halteromyces radiatus TaxID=101107 RepID=UPI002220518C
MPKSKSATAAKKQSTIKTRVSRRRGKAADDQHSPLTSSFLSKDDTDKKQQKKKEQPLTNEDTDVSSTIVTQQNKNDTTTPQRRIEIHQTHLSDMDKKLRAFDLNYQYGPCVGLSRLERWERAQALGLHPPIEIRDLLLDKKRNKKDTQECLFYGNV